MMKNKRFTGEQIVGILRAAETTTMEAPAGHVWRVVAIHLLPEATILGRLKRTMYGNFDNCGKRTYGSSRRS